MPRGHGNSGSSFEFKHGTEKKNLKYTNTNYHITKKLWCLLFLHDLFSKKMEFLFGSRKTPEQMLKQNQRALNRAMRELDRERSKLEQQEKKIIADIKKMAKQGQMVRQTMRPVLLCKLWRLKSARIVMIFFSPTAGRSQDHGQGSGPHPALRQEVHHDESQHPGSQSEDTDAQVQQQHGTGHERCHQSHGHHEQTGLSDSCRPIRKQTGRNLFMGLSPCRLASAQLKLPQIQKIMMEFEKQSEIMDMKEEMMNDAIDDAMGDEDDEDERWGRGNASFQSCHLSQQKTLLKTSNSCHVNILYTVNSLVLQYFL